jgi:exodeoxyribonuclease V beta subunit
VTAEFDLLGSLPSGRLVIDASAGTGKTYSLSALVVRHVAERGVEASELLVVTFTRAAAAELRDRTRRVLVESLAALDSGRVPNSHPWMQVLLDPDEAETTRRRERIAAVIANFDEATITTIHGFCQQALRQLGLRSGSPLNSELGESGTAVVDEVCRDLVIAALVDQPDALSWPGKDVRPATVLNRLIESVNSLLGNPGAVAVPHRTSDTPAKKDTPERLTRWVDLVHQAVDEVARRRVVRQEMGYDDLVTRLNDAITDPSDGPAVVAALSSRYKLVLVDEFQDTDPVQWRIFETAFKGDLVTVGDPKQAIYRFRGADVHAYLAATAGHDPVRLRTNYRSDADLVKATNALVDGVELGAESIVADPVHAAPSAPDRSLSPGVPVVVRRVSRDPRLMKGSNVSSPLVARSILRDLVHVVTDLFDNHELTDKGDVAPVNPGDIAILVPSHTRAAEVIRALGRAGIPAVTTRTGSVLDTPAADEWATLLAALERPSHAPTVRAAGLGVFLRRSPADLDPLADGATERLAELQQQCAKWADQLASRPLLAWYDEVRSSSGLVSSLLEEQGGERELTDIDHVAELLASEFGGVGTSAVAVRRGLERMRVEAEEATEPGPQMRRIDSDAQAVQVTTLHSSKGLEYPIVLLPFSWQSPPSRGPLIYNDNDGQRIIDIATSQGWGGPDTDTKEKARKHYAAVAQRGDQLRLLYVGLTRAQHRTIVWWAPSWGSDKSALATVLFDRDSSGEPQRSQPKLVEGSRGGLTSEMPKFQGKSATDADAIEILGVLAERSDGLIEMASCAIEAPLIRWNPPAVSDDESGLAVADPGDRKVADPTWRRWSFTSITRTREWTGGHSFPEAPVRGGSDEPTVEPDEPILAVDADPVVVADLVIDAQRDAGAPPMLLADVAGGTAFGTLVHEVLEVVDPTSVELEADLQIAVDDQLHRDRIDVDPEVLITGLAAAVRTPLGPFASGRRLADLPATDRLAELEFDLPVADGRVAVSSIGDVLLATLPADDPMRPYAEALAADRFSVDLAGYLQGSIDAVLRVPGVGDDHRYVVVDYKSNRLHARGAARPLDAYHPDRLVGAMAEHDYVLQALLYNVALHRFLRWRLPDYRPTDHLGGIAYLFLRGMVGEQTPTYEGQTYGVFTWCPPVETVEALDRLMATGALV